MWWNNVLLDVNRVIHSTAELTDKYRGPPLSARALGVVHIAMHDAYFSVFPYGSHQSQPLGAVATYLEKLPLDPIVPTFSSSQLLERRDFTRQAVSAAAITVLKKLYSSPSMELKGLLMERLESATTDFELQENSTAYRWGQAVANAVLGHSQVKDEGRGPDRDGYTPYSGQDYFFDRDPSHPNKVDYHAPFYGSTARPIATHQNHRIADPPVNPHGPQPPYPGKDYDRHLEAVEDVHRMGGAETLPTTKRNPYQTAGGLFWAYDGTKLLGTPPRLYNQILRQIAYDRRSEVEIDSDTNNAEFLRLLTMANVAMADSGVFCWRDKYKYELWRPLSGVRSDPTDAVPFGHARPTWKVFGAPSTNSDSIVTAPYGFKPPFPAYPSGHATFGAACFQIARRFFEKRDPDAPLNKDGVRDRIEFEFVSDELNGKSRDLYWDHTPIKPITEQKGFVRPRTIRKFHSLWQAIFDNALSRIWLGVHWHFDACAGEDVMVAYTAKGEGDGEGKVTEQPRPKNHTQLFQVEEDGTTRYKEVNEMDFFKTTGPRKGATGDFPYGGIPLGIMVADDIFDNALKASDTGPLGEGPRDETHTNGATGAEQTA
jgi:vanadium chloroperoxidase